MASITKTPAGTYQAFYRDRAGKQHTKTHKRRRDAEQWLTEQTAKVLNGTHVGPAAEKVTIGEWAETWLRGHAAGRRPATLRQAATHLKRITAHFGHWPLAALRPSDVREWVAALEGEGLEPSYVYALHSRLAQLYSDAIHDGLTVRNPCSRRTSPPAAKQRPFVCTHEQVEALEQAMPEHLRITILLGAWLGLRVGEVCGLRTSDLDLTARTLRIEAQWTGAELKTGSSRATFALGDQLYARLADLHDPEREWLLVNQWGEQLQPRVVQREWAKARQQVDGLPEGFRFHDLRHFLASYLIASGADIKAVQHRMRHASATVTLNVYSHLMPKAADATVALIDAALAAGSGAPAGPAVRVAHRRAGRSHLRVV